MMNAPLRVVAEMRWTRREIGLTAFVERGDGAVDLAQPLTLHRVEQGEQLPPTMSLQMTAAQELMDELWRCGIRPTEAAGSAGQAAAMQRHLDDMRKIAFHGLGVAA